MLEAGRSPLPAYRCYYDEHSDPLQPPSGVQIPRQRLLPPVIGPP